MQPSLILSPTCIFVHGPITIGSKAYTAKQVTFSVKVHSKLRILLIWRSTEMDSLQSEMEMHCTILVMVSLFDAEGYMVNAAGYGFRAIRRICYIQPTW